MRCSTQAASQRAFALSSSTRATRAAVSAARSCSRAKRPSVKRTFGRVELVATLAGVDFYHAFGYTERASVTKSRS